MRKKYVSLHTHKRNKGVKAHLLKELQAHLLLHVSRPFAAPLAEANPVPLMRELFLLAAMCVCAYAECGRRVLESAHGVCSSMSNNGKEEEQKSAPLAADERHRASERARGGADGGDDADGAEVRG